jgi:hypothetical protein
MKGGNYLTTVARKKEEILKEFYFIRGNENIIELKAIQEECKLYLINDNDEDIKDLINVIEYELIYFIENDMPKAKEYVIDIWYRLCGKDELSFYQIRMLNNLLLIAPSIEKIIETSEDCLIQLEKYKDEEEYYRTKMVIKINLSYFLLENKYFSNSYKSYYDDIILTAVNEVIDINIMTKKNDKYLIAMANIRKGLLFKDEKLIYLAVLLLQELGIKEIEKLVETYLIQYNIVL